MNEISTPLLQKGIRLAKSIVTGGAASLVDMSVLVLLVEIFHVTPSTANLPALVVGSGIQFWGNRSFVFGVTGAHGWKRQAFLFALIEVASIALNWVSFYLLLRWTSVHYAMLRPVIGAVIYLGFSYPIWGKIFRAPNLVERNV